MSDVTLTYKGETIVELDASGSKTLKTAGKFCEADIELEYVKSGADADPNKAVKFYDYDGTLLYSFTRQEFNILASMPENPRHEGLRSLGWNWTLSDAKAYVTEYGRLNIGQHYITSDGKTRLYIFLPSGATDIEMRFAISGTIDIDWGDGSSHSTVTGSDTSLAQDVAHSYSNGGWFTIAVSVPEGAVWDIRGSSNGSYLFYSGPDIMAALYKVELGANVRLGNYGFKKTGLRTITVPDSRSEAFQVFTAGAQNVFQECSLLSFFVVPEGVTLGGRYFESCSSLTGIAFPKNLKVTGDGAFLRLAALRQVTLPIFTDGSMGESVMNNCGYLQECMITEGVTAIPAGCFWGSSRLISVVIPSTVTQIGSSVAPFSCSRLKELHFKATTPPTAGGSGSFYELPRSCKIFVPYSEDHSVLAAYQSASNYPSQSYYTYVEE